MSIDKVREIVGRTPHMHYSQAKRLREFLLDHDIKDILELGFRHGVSTCFMSSILQEKGGGHITTIDLLSAKNMDPNIEGLLNRCGTLDYVDIYYEPTSYTWRLMRMLEEDPSPRFDFCYLDGAHNWFVDGFAFFLVDRLLRPGGWMIFDDLYWKYQDSPMMKDREFVRAMPEEEKSMPQITKVYELLVKPHPCYEDFRVEGDWAFARKKEQCNWSASVAIKSEQLVEVKTEYIGLGALLLKFKRKLKGDSW